MHEGRLWSLLLPMHASFSWQVLTKGEPQKIVGNAVLILSNIASLKQFRGALFQEPLILKLLSKVISAALDLILRLCRYGIHDIRSHLQKLWYLFGQIGPRHADTRLYSKPSRDRDYAQGSATDAVNAITGSAIAMEFYHQVWYPCKTLFNVSRSRRTSLTASILKT